METIVRENDIYKIIVGKCVLENGAYQSYQIVNKQYGVVEAETTVLPQVIDWFESFTRTMTRDKDKDKDKGEIIPFKSFDGDIH